MECLVCAGVPAHAAPAPLLLQLSDVHVSQFESIAVDRERREDLQLFTLALLPRLRVDAAVISGDLVHAKSRNGRVQEQHAWEWETYANITQAMQQAAGPQCQVLVLGRVDLVYVTGLESSLDTAQCARVIGKDACTLRTVTDYQVCNAAVRAPRRAAEGSFEGGVKGTCRRSWTCAAITTLSTFRTVMEHTTPSSPTASQTARGTRALQCETCWIAMVRLSCTVRECADAWHH